MAINRFGNITPVNFKFATMPLNAALMAFQAKQQRFDVARDMADELETFGIQALPQDQPGAKKIIEGWRSRIKDRLTESGGDYSRIYGDLREIRKEMKKQLNPGGDLHAISTMYANVSEKYKKYQESPDKYDPALVNMWYRAHFTDKNSPLYYKGYFQGDKNYNIPGLAQTPDLHKTALEAIKALHEKQIKSPGTLGMTQYKDKDGKVIGTGPSRTDLPADGKVSKEESLGLTRVNSGLYAGISTELRYKTPEEIKAVVASAWMSDPKARAYLQQFVEYRNALSGDPDSQIKFGELINSLATPYVNYAYTNKLVDIKFVRDPSFTVRAMRDLMNSFNKINPINDYRVVRMNSQGNMFRKISALDLIRAGMQVGIKGKGSERGFLLEAADAASKAFTGIPGAGVFTPFAPVAVRAIKAGEATGRARKEYLSFYESDIGATVVSQLINFPEAASNYGLYVPLAKKIHEELGGSYSLREFSRKYNEAVSNLGGVSSPTFRKFDVGTTKDLTEQFLDYGLISQSTIYEADENTGKVSPVEGDDNRKNILKKMYDSDGNRRDGVGILGVTTPTAPIPPSLIVGTADGKTYFVGAPVGLRQAYEPVNNLVEGIYSTTGESLPQPISLNVGGQTVFKMVKSKADIVDTPGGGKELKVRLYEVMEDGSEAPLEFQDGGVTVDGEDVLNMWGEQIEKTALPQTFGFNKNKNIDLFGHLLNSSAANAFLNF